MEIPKKKAFIKYILSKSTEFGMTEYDIQITEHVALVGIIGTTILVAYHLLVESQQLIWRSGTICGYPIFKWIRENSLSDRVPVYWS